MSYEQPVPVHSGHHHHHHLTEPHSASPRVLSSEYLNLSEPPEASKTPLPPYHHRLTRRSSSNYQTALLGDRLRNESISPKHEEKFTSHPKQATQDTYRYDDFYPETETGEIPQSREGAKRSLQRGSVDLTNVHDTDRGSFGIEYSPQGETAHLAHPTNKHQGQPIRPTCGVFHKSFNFHTNLSGADSGSYFGDSDTHSGSEESAKFEYAEFKRRMSKHE